MIVGKRTTLTLQRYSEASGTYSASVKTWADTNYTYTGTLGAISGNERMSSDRTMLYADYRFYTVYDSVALVTEKDRFKYGTRIFEIVFVDNVLQKYKDLVISLKEIK